MSVKVVREMARHTSHVFEFVWVGAVEALGIWALR
jgi:hypothetical protein